MLSKSNLVEIPLKVEGLSIKREKVLAEKINEIEYKVKNIPAFVYGVGYDDTVSILNESGDFKILNRGQNITIRLFYPKNLECSEINSLISELIESGGIYEIGKNTKNDIGKSLLLVSLPISLGFKFIEKLMSTIKCPGANWEYGNVYDSDGSPINWWIKKV